MKGGYAGEILHVDLTEGKIEKEELNPDIAEKFLGGLGTNTKLAYDLMKPGAGPLSPENPLIIGVGPLVGTYAPGASRVFLTTKLPINNAVGWCGGGGMYFGCMLKCAGYDHVVISGRSDKPVYLKIFDDTVEICDAAALWGKGIDESTDMLYEKYGRPLGVIAIGQAGENLVKYSMALIDRRSSGFRVKEPQGNRSPRRQGGERRGQKKVQKGVRRALRAHKKVPPPQGVAETRTHSEPPVHRQRPLLGKALQS